MDLLLHADEANLILRVLKQQLPELRNEISRTENYAWRQDLKRDEVMLKAVMARLEQAIDDAESPDPAERIVEEPLEI
jgi:hypothetical protein